MKFLFSPESASPANAPRRTPGSILLCCTVLLAMTATWTQAATRTVTNTADSGPGSLRQTIAAATVGDTIQFSVGGTIVLTSGELKIDKNLTVAGPGAKQLAVSGNRQGRVFVNSARVTLSGLAIVNGTDESKGAIGGGIYNNSDGNLTLDNCIVSKNFSVYGGGVCNDGTLVIKSSSLISNTSSEAGGGVYNSGVLTLDNSTVAGNESVNGAGIFNEVYVLTPDEEGDEELLSAAEVTINQSRLTNNRADLTSQTNTPGAGGVSNNGGHVTINSSTIDNNTSNASSGGLDSYAIREDTIPEVAISNSTIANNSGRRGGILTESGTLLLKSCTIAGNNASNRDFTGGGITNNGSTVTIGNSIIANNMAYGQKRDLSGSFVSDDYNLIQRPHDAALSGATGHNIIGQDANVGPLSYNGGPTPTLALPLSSPAVDQGNSLGLTQDQRGVARPLDNPSIANASGGDGSDIGAVEVTVSGQQNSPSLIVTTIEDKNDGTCSVSDCSLREAITRANFRLDANTITFRPELRGTIELTQGQLSITAPVTITGPAVNRLRISARNRSRVLQNTATGVSLLHLALSQGKADIGGAILNSGILRLSNCVLSANTGTEAGGAIYQQKGILTLTDTLLASNVAKNGAGLYNRGIVSISSSTLTANQAGVLGGAIHNQGALVLTNSTLSGNIAPDSAALYNLGGNVRLRNSTLTLNTSASSSSSVTNQSGSFIVASTIIAANGASDIAGQFSSLGQNLVGRSTGIHGNNGFYMPGDLVGTVNAPLSPKLGPLQNNGGSTPTHALLPGSPALDAGKRFDVTTDQRGVLRSLNLPTIANRIGSDGSDIGSFELDVAQNSTTLFVNATEDHDDGACSLSDCTLREAMTAVNKANAPRSIQFHIPRSDAGFTNGIFFIQPSQPLPVLTNSKTVIDGFSQTSFGGNTNPEGPEVVLSGAVQGNRGDGLVLRASNCVVQGLVINDFSRIAVVIDGKTSAFNTIRGCYIGTTSRGTGIRKNSVGVVLTRGAHDNLIGGEAVAARNIISGNATNIAIGISTTDNTCHHNRMQGNFIGLTKTGTAPISIGSSDQFGIFVFGPNNLIGGTTRGEGNVVGCRQAIVLGGIAATRNRVQGNTVGLDVTGTKLILNTEFGIYVQDGTHNLIGGLEPGAGNVVGGCIQVAIGVQHNPNSGDDAASHNVIQGNFIGVDKTGTVARPNQCNGVQIINASYTLVGGTDRRARNIIAASKEGVGIFDDPDTSIYRSVGTVVQGNYIGTDVTGTKPLANSDNGVLIAGSSENLVGGTKPGAGNLISGNAVNGVLIYNTGFGVPEVLEAIDNKVQGNLIGTDRSGTRALGNGKAGVKIQATLRTVVGGSDPAARNLISANKEHGVFVTFDQTLDNNGFGFKLAEDTQILGNYIGTDRTGTRALGNADIGVVTAESLNTTIGGTLTQGGNLISSNSGIGIVVAGTSADNNRVSGNKIGTDITGTKALANTTEGIIVQDATNTIIGGTGSGTGNLISCNIGNGVAITGENTDNTQIQGNRIGTDITGTQRLGNGRAGLLLIDSANTTVGGKTANSGNLISGNTGNGVTIVGLLAKNNKVQGNIIGANATGTSALANSWGVLLADGATLNTIGGSEAGAANLIAGNDGIGVAVYRDGTKGNSIRRNSIHDNFDTDGQNLGIDLHASDEDDDVGTITPNDPMDTDDGPNRLQNYPILTQITTSAGSTALTRLTGTINSTPNKTFVLDFYRNPGFDPSGNAEAELYLRSITVQTDASGNASFNLSVAGGNVGEVYTATATDLETGDTSELSPGQVSIAQPTTRSAPKSSNPSKGSA